MKAFPSFSNKLYSILLRFLKSQSPSWVTGSFKKTNTPHLKSQSLAQSLPLNVLAYQNYLALQSNGDFLAFEKTWFNLRELFLSERQDFWQLLLYQSMKELHDSALKRAESIQREDLSWQNLNDVSLDKLASPQVTEHITLTQQLMNALFNDLMVFKEKELFCYVVPGIYLIFHKPTQATYIGESKDIFRRFAQHQEDLIKGTHANKLLQSLFDSRQGKINSSDGMEFCSKPLGDSRSKGNNNPFSEFEFLVFDASAQLKTKKQRLQQEDYLINHWPGPLLNIKGNDTALRFGPMLGFNS